MPNDAGVEEKLPDGSNRLIRSSGSSAIAALAIRGTRASRHSRSGDGERPLKIACSRELGIVASKRRASCRQLLRDMRALRLASSSRIMKAEKAQHRQDR